MHYENQAFQSSLFRVTIELISRIYHIDAELLFRDLDVSIIFI